MMPSEEGYYWAIEEGDDGYDIVKVVDCHGKGLRAFVWLSDDDYPLTAFKNWEGPIRPPRLPGTLGYHDVEKYYRDEDENTEI